MPASFFAMPTTYVRKWIALSAAFALLAPQEAEASLWRERTASVWEMTEAGSHAAPGARGQADASREAMSRAGEGQTVRVVATGYTAGVESTGKKPGHPQYGITFSGVKVRRGKLSTIAADPKLFPMGTVLYIPGYGYGIVADTGSRIKGRRIDLYFPSRKQVFREWGKRTVDVRVVKRGTGKVTETMFKSLTQEVIAFEKGASMSG